MMRRQWWIPIVLAGLLLPGGGVATAALPDLDRIDPRRYPYGEALVERHLITARDGITSLALDVIRPVTTEPVPTILIQSPYYNTLGRGFESERKVAWAPPQPPSVAGALFGAGAAVPFPEWYDEYFVPRGYAVVLQDQRGTRNSSGCQVYGGRQEIDDAVDVIGWIASQAWSNGAVGMTGGSYDGTVAIGAASRAPEPLKAIIPIRAIDRWYDYHFFNGVQSSSHLATPWLFTSAWTITDLQNSGTADALLPVHVIERKACAATIGAVVSAQYTVPVQDATSPFWAERDYLKDAHRIRAATFLIHGLEDANVKPMNAGHLWSRLPARTPRALWWFRGGHADPASPRPDSELAHPFRSRFIEATHRWFAQYLKGLDAGADAMAPVSVQDEDGHWWDAAAWPPPARDHTLHLGAGIMHRGARAPEATLDGALNLPLTFESPSYRRARRLAGQSYVRLNYTLDAGGDVTFVATLSVRSGDGSSRFIARGYARGGHREQIRRRGPSWPSAIEPHAPGEPASIVFPVWHHDVTLRRGDRLVLEVATMEQDTARGTTAPRIRIARDGSSRLVVPFARALAPEQRAAYRAYPAARSL